MPAERLQKLMAAAGIGSRRTCETLISEGRVQVNGKTVTELGVKADPARDRIMVDGKRLEFQPQHIYYKVHKPRGVISDIGGDEVDLRTGELRRTVDDLLPPRAQSGLSGWPARPAQRRIGAADGRRRAGEPADTPALPAPQDILCAAGRTAYPGGIGAAAQRRRPAGRAQRAGGGHDRRLPACHAQAQQGTQ